MRLSAEPEPGVGRLPHLHPFLRRWDHRGGSRRQGRTVGLPGGAVRVEEGEWLPLEDGVEVYFAKDGTYRTGDHWIVPARTATGSVEWPTNDARKPLLQAPTGIARHFAPLALVKGEDAPVDLRLVFAPLGYGIPAADEATLAAEALAAEEEYAAEATEDAPAEPRSQTTSEAETAVEGDK